MSAFSDFMLESGYELKTTFWEDFSIADRFGIAGVEETFNISFDSWKDDIVYITELSLVLNHKIWQHYNSNEPLARIYNNLWDKVCIYIEEHYTGDDLGYFYEVTD